jgi:Protein of unknown function (DUF3263)
MLSDDDKVILEIEGQRFRLSGHKEQIIRERLGMSPTRYYQRLNVLLEEPDALAHAPATVSRLRRLRAQRMRHAS